MRLLLPLLFLACAFSAEAKKKPACPEAYEAIAAQGKRPDLEVEIERAIAEAEQRLGFHPEYRIYQTRIELRHPEGLTVGAIDFLFPKKKTLEIDYMSVKEDYRRNGVSEALFAVTLREHPEIKKIHTDTLASTNEDALRSALEQGMPCLEAIKATPAYRARARFGFTEILDYECRGGEFTVRRPKRVK